LYSGNDGAEIGEQCFDNFRAGVACFDQLADAGEPDGDERKFGGSEKGVYADQEKHGEEVEGDHG
jgi:hypothetical protein